MRGEVRGKIWVLSQFRGVTIEGVWIGDSIYWPLRTTSNYSATADLHNSQITAAHAKPFPACCVISRSLTTASNSGDCSASDPQVLSSQPPVWNSALKGLNCVTPDVFKKSPRHAPRRKHSPSVVVKACLLRRCIGTVAARERVYRAVAQKRSSTKSPLSNGSIRHNIKDDEPPCCVSAHGKHGPLWD
jgi:hypothetical protein